MSLLNDILKTAVEAKASDVHFNVGQPPLFRIHTVLKPSDFPIITAEGVVRTLKEILAEHRWKGFEELRDADFSYEITGVGASASTPTTSAIPWRCRSEPSTTRSAPSKTCSFPRSARG